MNKKHTKTKKTAKQSSRKSPLLRGGLSAAAAPAEDPRGNITTAFTRWKLITYAWVIFLPPYALYRIWSKKSEFRRSEQAVWTMIIIAYLAYLVQFLLLS